MGFSIWQLDSTPKHAAQYEALIFPMLKPLHRCSTSADVSPVHHKAIVITVRIELDSHHR
jgi:hypothetical protein